MYTWREIPLRVSMILKTCLYINEPCTLHIDLQNTGAPIMVKAQLNILMMVLQNQLHCCGEDHYSHSFIPQKRGRHELHIMYNSPAIHRNMIYVTDNGRVSLFTLTREFVAAFGHKPP